MKLHRRDAVLGAAALTFLGLTLSNGPLAAAEVGQPAPTFTATDSNGKTQNLTNYAGKVVVLEWTNDGCPFVGKHYGSGAMQALQKTYTGKGVVWLSVISSAPGQQGAASPERANELTITRAAEPTAVILDPKGTLGHLYEAKTTPDMFVIDAKGTLVYAGAIDDKPTTDKADIATAHNYVAAALDEVLAGKPVTTSVTHSYGCSVKYGTNS